MSEFERNLLFGVTTLILLTTLVMFVMRYMGDRKGKDRSRGGSPAPRGAAASPTEAPSQETRLNPGLTPDSDLNPESHGKSGGEASINPGLEEGTSLDPGDPRADPDDPNRGPGRA